MASKNASLVRVLSEIEDNLVLPFTPSLLGGIDMPNPNVRSLAFIVFCSNSAPGTRFGLAGFGLSQS